MRGELIAVWPEAYQIWKTLEEHEDSPEDLYCELYRILSEALRKKPTVEELADTIDDPDQSKTTFLGTIASDLLSERDLATFFEKAHEALEDLGGDPLSNLYFNLLSEFLEKYSLRYDLRRPCQLCPTLAGVFTGLIRELRNVTASDGHLDSLMKDFEGAVRDLRGDQSEVRIKTCIQKQMNLLEALGRIYPGVTKTTLGAICDQIKSWPHEKLKTAMKNLYGFSCDYPGIRHGGTPGSALRKIDMRDLVAITILLTGFTPYLEKTLNAIEVFGGGTGQVKATSTLTSPATTITSPRLGFPLSLGMITQLIAKIFGKNR